MNKKKPVLYDYAGNEIEKTYPQTGDPNFLHGLLTSSNTAKIEKQPYRYHSWVFACVYRIMVNISALPHVLFEYENDDAELIRKHEILKLFRRPNYLMSGTELWEYIVLNLMLPTTRTPGGQCFLVPENGKDVKIPNFRNGDIPKEIWPFSDETIKPRRDPKTKMINGWRFVVAGIETMQFELDEIIRIRLVNPYDIELGLSPYCAAGFAVQQDVKSDEYNTRFFENMGVLGGILTTEQEIDTAQARQIKAEFAEEYGGSGNAGKVAVFGLGVKYEQFLKSNLDMQFAEQKKDNRLRIQAAYGVPDEEIAIFSTGMNRATAAQADKNFWQKTLLPLDRKIMDGINVQWIENIERKQWRIKSDLSKVEALKSIYTEEIQNAERLCKMNVPPAEALRVTDVPVRVDQYAWLEQAYVNVNLVPISSIGNEPVNSGETVPPPKKEIAGIFDDMDEKAAAIIKATECATDEERQKISEKWIKTVLNPGERSMGTKVKRHFTKLKKEMIANVEKWLADTDGKSLRQIMVDPKKFVFNKTEALRELQEIEKDEVGKQAKREEANLKHEYGDAITWNATDETIGRFVQERQVYVQQINTHTFNVARVQIGAIVQQGVENNWTPQELAKNLKGGINAIKTDGSAMRIARTEMGAISNRSRADAFIESGIKRHQWINSRDERVRGTHRNEPEGVGGQERNVGSPFSNGLKFPQEPGAPAGECINCRCITIALI